MTRRKLKTPEFQNMKTIFFQSSQEGKGKYPIAPLVKPHKKKLKTPKMIRRKLKTSELQNIKTKDLPNFHKKSKYLPPCETSHKKLKIPKMTRRKLKIPNFKIRKQKTFKVHTSHFLACETSHKFF
jgi:hypothetical protein